MADNTIRTNVTLSKEVHEYFKDRSEKTGVSMSSLMFLALEEHMKSAHQILPVFTDYMDYKRQHPSVETEFMDYVRQRSLK